MERFDGAATTLVIGETVRITVTSHEPWGVMATVHGHEDVGASVDGALIDSPCGSPRALPHEYPSVGTQMNAVIQEISRFHPPMWLRLTLRAADLLEFRTLCALCGLATVLSPGGDGVTLDVRSTDGPGATSFAAHRECLIERLHPRAVGEPARVASLGRSSPADRA